MTWYAWVLVAAIAASTLLTVGNVGKPRTPTSAEAAAVTVVINGLIVWGIVALAVRP